jgi:predicted nucleic acid-binding protein
VIDATDDAPVFVSVVTLGELDFGVESCVDPVARAARADSLRQIESRPNLPVTRQTAAAIGLQAASVKQARRSPRPRYTDLWAAQAIEQVDNLLTLNTADFGALAGLKLATLQ